MHEETEGLVVLGFPCNQFGAQEPGSNEEVLEFARSKYDVDFPMFAKIEVNGAAASPLYEFLKTAAPGDIAWNFDKLTGSPVIDAISIS